MILEHMFTGRERGLADPVRPLAAHMGKAKRVAIHPLHHEVTARCPHRRGCPPALWSSELCGQPEQKYGKRAASSGALSARRASSSSGQPASIQHVPHPRLAKCAQLLCDHHRLKRAAHWEHSPSFRRSAIDTAPRAIVKQRFFDLHFDQLALFLDDNDQIKPIRPSR